MHLPKFVLVASAISGFGGPTRFNTNKCTKRVILEVNLTGLNVGVHNLRFRFLPKLPAEWTLEVGILGKLDRGVGMSSSIEADLRARARRGLDNAFYRLFSDDDPPGNRQCNDQHSDQ